MIGEHLEKECTGCAEVKPLHDFTLAAKGKFGRGSRCKTCVKAYNASRLPRALELKRARYAKLMAPAKAEAERKRHEYILLLNKRCSGCGETKAKEMFGRDSRTVDGLKSYCRGCRANEFADHVSRMGRNKKSDSWKSRNPEKAKAIAVRHNSKVHNRIHHSISARIYKILSGKNGSKTKDVLGYTSNELMSHLERQFQGGMSWANYGEWHVDHIRPLSSFRIEAIDDPQLKVVWGLANLRPLWGEDNLRKNAKKLYLL